MRILSAASCAHWLMVRSSGMRHRLYRDVRATCSAAAQQRHRSQLGERAYSKEIATTLNIRDNTPRVGREGSDRLSHQICAGVEHRREQPAGRKQDVRVNFDDEVLSPAHERSIKARNSL